MVLILLLITGKRFASTLSNFLICKIENQIAPGRCNSNFIFFAFLGFLDQEQPKCSWHKKEMLYNLVRKPKNIFFQLLLFCTESLCHPVLDSLGYSKIYRERMEGLAIYLPGGI